MKGIDAAGAVGNIRNVTGINSEQNKSQGSSFEKMLVDSLKKVNNLQLDANNAVQQLALGQKENIHETMIAVEKASISFQMMMEIRNKIIDAYKQIEKSM
jgi:flagellar hook-basal body complex protein FliE